MFAALFDVYLYHELDCDDYDELNL